MEQPSFGETIEHSSFEEQFKHLEEVRLPSGTAEVGDVTPERLKDEVPILIAQAWALDVETYKDAMKQLFDDERRAISIEHPRIGSAIDSSMNVEEISKKYPKAELRKALNILEVLEEKGIEKVDVIAHSEGAINIAIAAAMYPEKFRSIVLFGPAGMMEDETWKRLIKGFTSQGGPRPESMQDVPITEGETRTAAAAAANLWKYPLKNPRRSFAEVSAMKHSPHLTRDLLPYLHDEFGINIGVMSGQDDPVFPQAEVKKAVSAGGVDSFISVPGGHGMLGDRPDMVMPTAEALLEMFAEREKTSEQKKALAEQENQAGVRYIPGEGLVIAPYIKEGR